jgi:heat shock protein HslJ
MKRLLPLILFGLIAACSSQPDQSTDQLPKHIPTGIFSGVIPCADCDGIYLEIQISADSTAEVKRAYSGKPGVFTDLYKVDLRNGEIIEFSSTSDTLYFLEEDNQLRMLSENGERIIGSTEELYVLKAGRPEGFRIHENTSPNADFRGLGHEPFWSLDIRWASEYRIVFSGDSITGTLRNPDITGDTIIFSERNESRNVLIRLWPETSVHPASGQLFLWRITLVVNGERFEGLGDFFKGNIHQLSGRWVLNNYELSDTSVFDMKQPELTLNTAEMRCYGNDGCNSFNGGFEVSGDRIIFSPLASTRMACQNLPDASFNRVLSRGIVYDAKNQRLVAGDLKGEYLIFRRR